MPPTSGCPKIGTPSPEVTESICRVPSTSFSQAPSYTLRVHQCRFRVRSQQGICYFLEVISCLINPLRLDNGLPSSHIRGLGIFTQFPSTTPLGLALGAGLPCADYPSTGTLGLSAAVSLTLLYVTYVSILASDTSRAPHRTPSQAYRTLRYRVIINDNAHSFGSWL